MIEFIVVTAVAAPRSGGNMATPIPLYKSIAGGPECEPFPLAYTLDARIPVFHVGEILVVDHSGREISGRLRKPDKWDVETEVFSTVEEAITRAREIMDDRSALEASKELGR